MILILLPTIIQINQRKYYWFSATFPPLYVFIFNISINISRLYDKLFYLFLFNFHIAFFVRGIHYVILLLYHRAVRTHTKTPIFVTISAPIYLLHIYKRSRRLNMHIHKTLKWKYLYCNLIYVFARAMKTCEDLFGRFITRCKLCATPPIHRRLCLCVLYDVLTHEHLNFSG